MAEAAPAVAPRELVLDRYRPLRPLGTGGSGSVWLARDEQTGLDVALKVVARDGKAGHRAEREAAVAARLRHERCLRAYACGSDTRHVYVAYEYAPGRTLRDALRAGELRDHDAVEAGAQVLEGLAHAHARGVVHRDVKPANVLLADGEGVSVRLLDFGLAQTDDAETLTAVGDVPGTLAYIPPERLAGGGGGGPLRFSPGGWGVGLALLAAALAALRPRVGLAFALAVPILPLGNVSFGLAALWTGLAAGWLALSAGEARSGLLFAAGPLLPPVGALGLLPLLALRLRSPVRRVAHPPPPPPLAPPPAPGR